MKTLAGKNWRLDYRFLGRLIFSFFIGAFLTGTVLAQQIDEPRPSRIRSASRSRDSRETDIPKPFQATDKLDLPHPFPDHFQSHDWSNQTPEQAAVKSQSCVSCHQSVKDPHMSPAVNLGCVDCHGGNPNAMDKNHAHVYPSFPDAWRTSANPVRSYTLLNHENPAFVRFVNPGDLRIAHISCGECHQQTILEVRKSMMTHGCMLLGSALYNNGAVRKKWSQYGESYSMYGKPQRLQTVPPPTPYEMEMKGILPYLDPLPRFQMTQPSNTLRIFERGGRFNPAEAGIPQTREEPGRPRTRLSNRGFGTANRTDPVFIGLQKTRLLDPTLNFLGTNDHPGDYRSSGCTACHVIYANDRSPMHSGPFAKYGNMGTAANKLDPWVVSIDPTIPKDEPGHPIQHRFTTAIPTSQCIVCHVHPGTNVMNSYLGYMWWDQETDGQLMYPTIQQNPTAEQYSQDQMSNPNEGASQGLWSDPEFLARTVELNPQLDYTQFADFHGHGWVFRAVFKKNRSGQLLDHKGRVVQNVDSSKLQKAIAIPQYTKQMYFNRDWDNPVDMQKFAQCKAELDAMRDDVPLHLLDIHLEKGMHCVDCHFVQDVHGNTKLYGEVRAAIEITCIDCHGDTDRRAVTYERNLPVMRTTGPAADTESSPRRGLNLLAMRTPSGKRRFELHGNRIIQNSMVEKGLSWEITQVADTVNPKSEKYNALSALAKTVRFEKDTEKAKFVWGEPTFTDTDRRLIDNAKCAHSSAQVSCIACHSSWNQSCYGCHLSQKANRKTPSLHNEGDITRNAVSYNFQTLRDEVYMLAKDGNVTGNKIGPARSSCAIHVGSYNQNRESVYFQQQTISTDGPSGIAFATNVPHTVRGRGETKGCSDCHVSEQNDNNALMAQLMMHGTNYLNFIGRYCWVAAGEEGLFAVPVTERREPQAVIGGTLHGLAFPDDYEEHLERDRVLEEAHEHPGVDIGEKLLHPLRKHEVLDLQLRGEYLYAACGQAGMRIYDVAFIDHKGFSERITTAPVSPKGQQFFVRSKYATSVAAPATTAPDPSRKQLPENHEPAIHGIYAYLYVTDRYEGLILIGAATLLDGDPTNNFVERALTYNPDGLLDGAESVTIVGTYAYICCDAGLVVLSIEDPLKPEVKSVIGGDAISKPRDVQVQFRYAFVCDEEGVKILDVTDLAKPRPVAKVSLPDAHSVYVARTYAYVAGGELGLVILDVKDPTRPKIDQIYDADGVINDLHDVKLGISYVSQFAYLADGCNGLRVVQLTSPETPGNAGFSPRPTPRLIATYPIPKHGEALAISKGVDRDRAVDESGNQISVFGRVGSGPLDLEGQQRLYMGPNAGRRLWRVIDGQRNFAIPPIQREQMLQRDLERYYR